MDSFKLEGRGVGVDKSRSAKVWIDVVASLPKLESKPYMIDPGEVQSSADALRKLGFRIVRVDLGEAGDPIEEHLLVELSRGLSFSELGAGSWAAFNDRLWDLLTAENEPPVAVLISGLDRLLPGDVHALIRCVHKLLSLTEAVGLDDGRADLQVEYIFVGSWG